MHFPYCIHIVIAAIVRILYCCVGVATADPDHASRRGSGRIKTIPGDDQYNKLQTFYDIHRAFKIATLLATRAWLRPVSRGNRHFTVDCGRQRQSGPRPDTRLLRQPALERPDEIGANGFSSSSWSEQIPAARGGGAQGRRRRLLERRGGGGYCLGLGLIVLCCKSRLKSTLSRIKDGLGPAQWARVQRMNIQFIPITETSSYLRSSIRSDRSTQFPKLNTMI
ncbi:hypothetical protein F511_40409 [Dorcoceras hygrometricum]|uniref:Uncharacterized protein n=1 Tax=Dorcoceras hygrometricum TaxID=472368 RepID=A0A2Z7C618_9LAMI|nr:hypothetical protein F511_40409 [Dorcoceras hygrometricum]